MTLLRRAVPGILSAAAVFVFGSLVSAANGTGPVPRNSDDRPDAVAVRRADGTDDARRRAARTLNSDRILTSRRLIRPDEDGSSPPTTVEGSRSADEWKEALRTGSLDSRREAAAATLTCSPELQQQLLPVLEELLRHESDGQIRLAVFDTLRKMGPAAAPAVPALVYSMKTDFGGRYNEERHQEYRVALALASIGKPAVESLSSLLSEERENLRAEAAMALGRIGPDAAAAVPKLIDLLGGESDRVRWDAVSALAAVGAVAGPDLTAAAGNANAIVRAAAIEAIGRSAVSDAAVVSRISSALNDEAAVVRAAAVSFAHRCGFSEEQLADRLCEAFRDSDAAVRRAALNAFGRRSSLSDQTRECLVRQLTDQRDDVALNAARLLSVGDPDALSTLLDAARNPATEPEQLAEAVAGIPRPVSAALFESLRDRDARVRKVAVLALGRVRPVHNETVDRLASLLTTGDAEFLHLSLRALQSLGSRAGRAVDEVRTLVHSSPPGTQKPILDILFAAAPHDEALAADVLHLAAAGDSSERAHAVTVLQAMGASARHTIPDVLPYLSDSDPDVRVAAAQFLGSHRSAAAAAVEPLRNGLREDDERQQTAFLKALGEIGAAAGDAVSEVLVCTHSSSPATREAAVETLLRLDADEGQLRETLLRLVQDPASGVRYQASRGIRRMGDAGMLLLPDLIRMTAHKDPDIAETVVSLLGRLERFTPTEETLQAVFALTDSSEAAVQRYAVRFTGLAGSAAGFAAERLEELAERGDDEIGQEAQAALRRIRGIADDET